MKFSHLAEYFEKLEATSSRLSLIDILSQLFKDIADPLEIQKVCYLVQGRVAPFFEATEIGMAEKSVASAIARAYGIDREEVLKRYEKLGDMGLTVQEFAPVPAPRQKGAEVGKRKGSSLSQFLEDARPERSLNEIHSPKSKNNPQSSQKANFNALEIEKPAAHGRSLTILEVVQILTDIAKTSGEGTVEKRTVLLSELLKKVDPMSAKFLVRIPLSNLRLGIGDPTILDALATSKLGDKKQRHYLEGAYNRTSDLGLIAKTLWEASNPVKAIEKVEKLQVTVGNPIRSELCERLPTPEKVIEKMVEVDAQYKYDGFRVQIHKDGNKVSMFSRNLENMTHMFPELIEGTLKQIKAKSVILDSEALAYNPESEEFLPFQETTKRRRKHNIEETAKKLPLKAFVFDILYKDGKSLIDEPLTKRIEVLKETISGDEILIPSKTQDIKDAKVLATMLEDAITKGLEGVVVKKLASTYEAGGRNFNWVKLKRHSAGELKDTIDCVILGYIAGRGKRTAFGAGALLVGVYDSKKDIFVTVSKIGTGLSDEEWQSIKIRTKGLESSHKPARVESLLTPTVWVKPEIVIEVLADEITRSPLHTAGMNDVNAASNVRDQDLGYALRFPRLVNFRDKDKKPEDATSVKELIEMFESQGKK